MIEREIKQNIIKDWDSKKAIILMGPRQVGKTTLINELVEGKSVLKLNGDDPQTRLQLSNVDLHFLKNLFPIMK